MAKQPPMDELSELQEERIELATRMRELGTKEVVEWTPEDQQIWDQIETRYDEVVDSQEKMIAANERAAKLAAINSKVDHEKFETRSELGKDRQERTGNPTQEQRALAMQAYLRHQHGLQLRASHRSALEICNLNPQAGGFQCHVQPWSWHHGAGMWASRGGVTPRNKEQRALSVGTDADGGYTVPEGFMAELEETLLAFGGFRRIARILSTTSGNDMPWPTMDDTGNSGAILAEASTIGASVDPTFGVVTLNAYKYSSKPVLVSAELLEDSAFNLATELARALGTRIGRATAAHFATGTGTGQPQGVTIGASAGKTSASATVIIAEELIDLQDSLDPAYEVFPSIGWAFRKATLSTIRKMRSDSGAGAGTGDFLWQPGLRAGEPDMLLGAPYAIIQEMPAAATTTIPIVYGAMEKYIIRDAGMIRFYRLDELYRANDQTGFITLSRHDGKMLQSSAIKKLTMA